MKPLIFIDFYKTLCFDRFWQSLDAESTSKIQEALFKSKPEMISDWMRGRYSSEEVNAFVAERTGIAYEMLWNVFVNDCSTMSISQETLRKISELREKFRVILITDNMDSFSRFTAPALKLDTYFDRIINSFEYRKIKDDNDGELLKDILREENAPFKNNIFIDDSRNIIDLFERNGGKGLLVTDKQNIDYHLNTL